MRHWFLAIHTVGFVASISSSSQAASLREVVAAAVRNSPVIAESTANRRAVDEELNQARGLGLPRLDFESASGWLYNHRPTSGITNDNRWGDTASLIGRQTLYDGGYRRAELDKQSARVGGAALRVSERSELIALEAVQSFLDIQRFNVIIRLADRNIAAHRKFLGLAQTRFRGGTSTQGEVYLAQERLFAAQALLSDARRSLGQAEARYINIVGVAPIQLGAVKRPSGAPASRQTAIDRARNSNPTLLAALRDVDAARADVDQAGSAFRPNVALEVRGTAGHDLEGSAGVRHDASARLLLSWNLFDGRIKDARVRERAERLGEIETRVARLRRNVDETVNRAWNDQVGAEDRLKVLARQIPAGRRLISTYQQEFEANKRSMLDLLEAQGILFNAQVQDASFQALAILARYQLIAVTGGLVAHFGIALDADADEALRPWNRGHGHLDGSPHK